MAPWCTAADIVSAVGTWKRADLTDAYSVSARALGMVPTHRLAAAIGMWDRGDRAGMAMRPKGYACGKNTTTPSLSEIRCIIPLTALMSLIDRILASFLQAWADAMAEDLPRPECFEGARPRTQILDLTHAASLGVERGLDNRGLFGISSSDIHQYYDHVNVDDTMQYLQSREFPEELAEAVRRAQSQPTLEIACGPETVYIPHRDPGAP